jgi:antitoxin VapB
VAINIKDARTDELARRLAAVTGEKITDAIRVAVEERLEREERQRGKASLQEIMAIAREIASQRVVDPRSADEIIGYDEHGLPS